MLAWSCHIAEVRPQLFLEASTRHAVGSFLENLFPPALDPAFVAVALRAAVRTLSIAVSGTVLSLVLGFPLGVLATPTLFRRGVLAPAGDRRLPSVILAGASLAARALLRFLRAVPDLLWALVFVVAVGLGPLPGALALGINYAGVVGRVFADLFEEAPPLPLEAMHAAGASRLQIFLLAILPQTAPGVLAYALYSFECCVRAASVLGFIGAGGIGYEISVSMRLFEYGQITTLLTISLLLILAADALSRLVRRRFRRAGEMVRVEEELRRKHFLSRSRGGGEVSPLRAGKPVRALLLAGCALALVLSFADSGFFSADGGQGSVPLGARLVRFAGQLLPPDLTAPFLRTLAVPLAQTVGISIVGTLIGLLLGGALALPSTATLMFPPAEDPGRRSRAGHLLRWVIYSVSRALLALLRSIPELLWVLLCIVAVGLGPFAGTLALGLHTAGVLGKLFAETLEEVDARSLLALRSSGATPLQVLLWGMLPQARGTLATYALLRWENNLRVSTVVGLVGGGGLGLALYNSVQLAFYPRVTTLILLVYLLVLGTDVISDRVRARGQQLAQEPERRVRELEAVQA